MLTAVEPDLRNWARSETFFLAQGLFRKACELLSPLTATESETIRKKSSQLIQKWKREGFIIKIKDSEGYPAWKVI